MGTRTRGMPACLAAVGWVRARAQYASAKWAGRVGRGRRGAGPDPVTLGEVGRGGPGLLAVEHPAPVDLGRLELHGGGVRARVGLGIPDGELDLVAQDLRQELGLHALVAMSNDGLANDADALADLRTSTAGQLLIEEVLVDTFALFTPVLGRPGHTQPTLSSQ